jgi:hypothetical protein
MSHHQLTPHLTRFAAPPCCCWISHSEEVSRARLNTLRGLGDHERVDEQLYHDYESEDARKVRIPVTLAAAWNICVTAARLYHDYEGEDARKVRLPCHICSCMDHLCYRCAAVSRL